MVSFAQPVFDYVNAPDSSYAWHKVGEKPAGSGRLISLQMTSQTWQGIAWNHRVAVAMPGTVRHRDQCLLMITGGDPAGDQLPLASMMAEAIGMPLAILGDIPNQPLYDDLREDGLIAHTFVKFMETGDKTWPLLFPMTKAAVRAMDMIQELANKEWGQNVESFVVTGASKRGWTTWFTSEVDSRVRASLPMVYNNLNLAEQMRQQLNQFGAFSEQIDDYTTRGLPQLLASEQGRELSTMVDPYTYRDRATMPKLIFAGTNDRYWPLDAANLYFDELPGLKYILHVPNSGHGLDDLPRVVNAAIGFTRAAAGEFPMPRFYWRYEERTDGVTLRTRATPAPQRALLWSATAPTRDFRDAKWSSQEVDVADGKASYQLARPESGYAALFMEYSFDAGGRPCPLSTLIRVVGPLGK
jgi:PhoPQ-activated pathogenicity-related protein